ncbi:ATP-binding cassette domain-containing protein [Rhizobium leguminosarum]
MTLARGEVVSLLGENGAVKTTFMSILFGHYIPDAGRILIDLEAETFGNSEQLLPCR